MKIMKIKKLVYYRSILKNYRFQSMFFKYFQLVAVLVLILIILFTGIIYFIYSTARKAELAYEAERDFSKLNGILDNIVLTYEMDYLDIVTSEDFRRLLTRSQDNYEKSRTVNVPEAVKQLLFMVAGDKLIDSIYVYLPKSGYVVTWTNDCLAEEFYDQEWLDIYRQYGELVWYRRGPRNNIPVVSVMKSYSGVGISDAVVLFNLKYARIHDLIDAYDYSATALISPDGGFIYHNTGSNLGENLSAENPEYFIYDRSLSQSTVVSEFNGSLLWLAYTNQTSGLTMISGVSVSHMNSFQSSLYKSLLYIIPAAILFAFLLSALISLRLYNYIIHILEVFQTPTANEDNLGKSAAEMEIIRSNILSMINKNEHLESEFARQLTDLRKAQSIALQTQINPHFLLNTLQIISFHFMRDYKYDSGAVIAISLLSEILRGNLDTQNYLSDVESEIELAKKYLQIESIRNDHNFTVSYKIDPNTRSLAILRFMLQPLLENSVSHGLNSSDNNNKQINITSSLVNNKLFICIEDNGGGINPDKLKELREKIGSGIIQKSTSIGLCNVAMRLRLIFGREAFINIESSEGYGTVVTVSLPAMKAGTV